MATFMGIVPWLVAMVVLIACSAFFSASETALFSLRERDRRRLKKGGRSSRTAAALLKEPERLLSAVLFWNLTVNMAYFAVASIVGFQILILGLVADLLAVNRRLVEDTLYRVRRIELTHVEHPASEEEEG